MKEFIESYKDRIHGVLSCFDRMLFRGYLPIMSGWQMAQFFNSSGIRFRELKPFLVHTPASSTNPASQIRKPKWQIGLSPARPIRNFGISDLR
jgi:hypothetical protein